MENLDIEKMSNIDISQDSVKSITDKCNHLKDLNKQIEDQEEKLSLLKHKARDLEERIIPEMMQEAGVSLLKLSDGSTVEVKPFYAAKIPESRVEEAFGWLRGKGFEDIIKNTVTASFNRAVTIAMDRVFWCYKYSVFLGGHLIPLEEYIVLL